LISPTESAGPTPYSEVNILLKDFLARVQAILQDRLVGFYLYGSLSLGDFDPQASDVDFLVVTTEEVTGSLLDALRDMHSSIAASGLPYARHLEGSYISHAALRRHDPANCRHPEINMDWDPPFQVNEHGSNWIIERYIVREHGVIVWGPAPKNLIDPISPHELREAVCDLLRSGWRQQLTGPTWLQGRALHAFAVLTMCRALYSLHHQGSPVSKPVAAAWALQTLDPRWQALIEQALVIRQQPHDEGDVDILPETLEFIRFTIDASEELCDQ